MIKKCKECANEFRTYESLLKIGKGKYCSRVCSDKHTLLTASRVEMMWTDEK